MQATLTQRLNIVVEQRLTHRAGRSGRPGGAAALLRIPVQGELANRQHGCALIEQGLLPLHQAQVRGLIGKLRNLRRTVTVRNTDQHQVAGLVNRADRLTRHAHRRAGHALNNYSHRSPFIMEPALAGLIHLFRHHSRRLV